jgi:amidase
MVHRLSGKNIYTFSKHNEPAITITAGDMVEIETLDGLGNQIQSPEDRFETMDWERVNPAAGPVYIDDAEPGDVLKVTIQEINVGKQGVISTGKGCGVLGDLFDSLYFKIIPIVDGKAVFDSKISLPLSPMIGVIGVAPEGEGQGCGIPGTHGGNMDNLMVAAGATLYLPVYVKGALFALGDLHAVMGDGEICVNGVEIAGCVRVKIDVRKDIRLKNPVLENNDYFTTIASAKTLDAAVKQATSDMAAILMEKLDLSLPDIVMLMSVAGHAQICQVVDPLMTARSVMPKWILDKYGFEF